MEKAGYKANEVGTTDDTEMKQIKTGKSKELNVIMDEKMDSNGLGDRIKEADNGFIRSEK